MKRYIEVEFDGKAKLLRFDFNAVAEIEEYFGKGISRVFNEEQIGFNTIRVFYWAGLRWKDKGLTVERVGNVLGEKIQDEGETIETLMQPILKALQASKLLGDVSEEEEETEAPAPKNVKKG